MVFVDFAMGGADKRTMQEDGLAADIQTGRHIVLLCSSLVLVALSVGLLGSLQCQWNYYVNQSLGSTLPKS
jgi:hypothetical protein